jgi:hypothetical protein
MQAIARAIRAASFQEMFEIEKEPALRVSDFGPLLLQHNPQVLHISGHSRPTEGLILENELREVAKVKCAELKDVVLSAGSNLQLVFFSFCYSADCASAVATQVAFAIGVEGKISDESALTFSPAFYGALAAGKSIPEAVAYGKSILGLQKLAGGEALRLEVNEGTDAATRLVNLKAADRDLKPAFTRVVRGVGTKTDRSVLRKAMDEGLLVTSVSETEYTENPKTDQNSDFVVDAGISHASLTPEAYRKVRETLFPIPAGIAPPVRPAVFIGREDDLRRIRQLLARDMKNADRENITVVRGWPGVGKTSLVGAIGHDAEIVRTFKDGVLWTSLEQKPHIISEMAAWGRALGSEEILRSPTVKDATAQLAALLSGRRMLLIVDDVWETGHATAFAEAAGEQCSVMITTRVTDVAEALTTDPDRIYNLPVLTEDFALIVLRILAPEVVSQHETECRELVHDLECLPLALHVAAGLLRSEAKLGWGVTDLIKRIREGTELINKPAPKDRIEKDGEIPSVKVLLQRSTDVLDEQTRDCFAFLGAFAPKPATFDLEALQAVWEIDDPKPTVRKLVGHGLLEPLGNGRFRMHRILVDHARRLCT